MPIQLQIVTPGVIAFSGEIDEIQVPGWLGQYGVLPQHAAMLTLTRPGVAVLHQGERQTRLLLGKGLAEVGDDAVTLLVDLCEEPDSIDKERAKDDLADARSRLKSLAVNTPAWTAAQQDAALAQARIDA